MWTTAQYNKHDCLLTRRPASSLTAFRASSRLSKSLLRANVNYYREVHYTTRTLTWMCPFGGPPRGLHHPMILLQKYRRCCWAWGRRRRCARGRPKDTNRDFPFGTDYFWLDLKVTFHPIGQLFCLGTPIGTCLDITGTKRDIFSERYTNRDFLGFLYTPIGIEEEGALPMWYREMLT